jgi:uncharacterized membrane protein YfcA
MLRRPRARVFLGVAEAGFFVSMVREVMAHQTQPAAVFITSVWYPRKQVQWRIAIFYCMGSLSGSFTGLIAYGVAHMDGRAGLAAWRRFKTPTKADSEKVGSLSSKAL